MHLINLDINDFAMRYHNLNVFIVCCFFHISPCADEFVRNIIRFQFRSECTNNSIYIIFHWKRRLQRYIHADKRMRWCLGIMHKMFRYKSKILDHNWRSTQILM
jgi:hypothetical protein